MSLRPRVVLGMPAYNRPDTLARAMETLLSQTFESLAIVIVDDHPTPEVRAIVETYQALDQRVIYQANPKRLGMIGNWRHAFDLGRRLRPEAEFFAWVSDHDIWHPRWLEVLVAALDSKPDVVLTYPLMERVYQTHNLAVRRTFSTEGVTRPLDRLRASGFGMTAGNCVYGLFRADVLERAGVFRPVLAPDRQIVVQCLLFGQSFHAPEVLWFREVAGMFSYGRQRRMFFPDGVPLHTYLPTAVQHFGVMLWDLGIRGTGLPRIGRVAGSGLAVAGLFYAVRRESVRACLDFARRRGWMRPKNVVAPEPA